MKYEYIKGYQNNERLIKSFHSFTQKVFGFDLIEWRNGGYWSDNYIPHSLVLDDSIVANISVSIMQLQVLGREFPAIQLGSVGVLPEFRGKGLSRIVMENVLEEYTHFPLIFLFANHGVTDYYPRFGFKRIKEFSPKINVSSCSKNKPSPVKIPISSELLKRLIDENLQHSEIIDARKNNSIYWFHLMYNYHDSIYYIKEKDVVFIAEYKGERVTLVDVLSKDKIQFKDIEEYIKKEETKEIYFQFTPDWLLNDYSVEPNKEDDIFFVLGDFPTHGINFKFPVTAHT